MLSDVKPYPPVDYGAALVVVLLICCALLLGWYGCVFWLTRHRKARSVATLQPLEPTVIDKAALRAKYLALIAEVETESQSGRIKSRAVHQKLSVLLRFFAQEAHGLRAFSLTLNDLRQTRYNQLTTAIASYYIPEFHSVLEGDVASALATAREVVTTWE